MIFDPLAEMLERGRQLHQSGKISEAKVVYREILAQAPKHADAWHLFGLAEGQTGNPDVGIRHIKHAIELEPGVAKFHNNLGVLLRAKNDPAAAMSFRRALELEPSFVGAWTNLGAAQLALSDAVGAVESFSRAAALAPDSAEAHRHLGKALHVARRREEAATAYRASLALDPARAETQDALGSVLYDMGQPEAALVAFRAALALKPDFAEAEGHVGRTLRLCGRISEAIDHLKRALALKPQMPIVHSNLLLTLNSQTGIDSVAVAREHRLWHEQHAAPLGEAIRPHANARKPAKKLRVGLVSGDLREHVVTRFLWPVLEHADPNALEFVAYSNAAREDERSRLLQTRMILWRRITGSPDEAVAELIRRDAIDVLVDLSGHTGDNRLLVFARKPAPVQITWLGYSNTSGLTAIDFRLTDPLADPVGATESLHSERLLRFPRCAWCYPPLEAPATCLPPAAPLVFGSFNSFAKLNPEVVRVWSRILHAEPRAVLALKDLALTDAAVRRDCEQRFAAHGIEPHRLQLLGRTPLYQEHLANYQRVHVALDPFPYNGTTTTCEALWMGVPVITLAGRTHASRVGVSLLTNVGLPNFVTENEEDYIALALATARDLRTVAHLRQTLREQMLASPLMDGRSFARDMENLLRSAWVEWCGR